MEGYSYTTIIAEPGQTTRIGTSFHLDDEAWIVVAGKETDRPVLHVTHGDAAVSIAPTSGPICEADVRQARKLAEAAAVYLVELERIHDVLLAKQALLPQAEQTPAVTDAA